MKPGIAPVKNVRALHEASTRLLAAQGSDERMALIYGKPGLGKSVSAAWLANQQKRAAIIRCRAIYTAAGLLEDLCAALGVPQHNSNKKTVDRIVTRLGETETALFVDEADYLVRKRDLIETLRDIHDAAFVPVVLIGEDKMPEKIAHIDRLADRMVERVHFVPLELEDAQLIADKLCEVTIKPDLVELLNRETRGVARLYKNRLRDLEQLARARDLKSLSLADLPRDRKSFLQAAA